MSLLDRLTPDEEEAIENLRGRLKSSLPPKMYDDSLVFYRFLKARDFDLDKAEVMLRKHIVWRKAFQLDSFLEVYNYTEVFAKHIQPSFIGFDKDGDVIRYFPLGNFDPKDVLKCMKMSDYTKHIVYWIEQDNANQRKENKKKGRNCYQTNFIFDLDNLTYANATNVSAVQLMFPLLNLLQDNYPERAKVMYIINAPAYFCFAFAIIKPLMTSATRRKIQVFNKNGWKEALLDIIDANVLPASLGGKRTDPDDNPLCLSFMSYAGKIPTNYHLSSEDRSFKNMSKVKTIIVPARTKIQIPVDVLEDGSFIEWEFEVKSKDIGFGLHYQTQDQTDEILPILRFCTPDGTETGSYKPKEKGTYIIMFDNSYGWLTSKEVHYCVTVVTKKDDLRII